MQLEIVNNTSMQLAIVNHNEKLPIKWKQQFKKKNLYITEDELCGTAQPPCRY